jgi:outer membrane protein assembly factor BamB
MRTLLVACCLLVLFSSHSHAHGEPAVGWRHDGTGLFPEAEPVLSWSAEENVLWKTRLPDRGNSMVVKVGDVLFLNCEPDRLLCLAARDGRILWERRTPMEAALGEEEKARLEANQARIGALKQTIEEGRREMGQLRRKIRGAERDARQARKALEEAPAAKTEERKAELARAEARVDDLRARREATGKSVEAAEEMVGGMGGLLMPRAHGANGYTSATPVSDGHFVYVVYGTGVVAAYDFAGNRRWCVLHEQPTHPWGHSASPRLVDGRLIVHIDTMMALAPEDGSVLWSADVEPGWGTPAHAEVGGVDLLATPKGALVRAGDGAVLARGLYELPYGSPIVHERVLYAVDEKGGWAYELPGSLAGSAPPLEPRWTNSPPRNRYYGSPVVVDGILYAMSRDQRFTAIDAVSGEILFTERVNMGRGSQLYGSLALAGEHLFVSHDNGHTAVIAPGRTFELVGVNPLEESRSSALFDGGQVYFRTARHLFCFGEG